MDFVDMMSTAGLDEWYEITETQGAPDNKHRNNWSKVMKRNVQTELLPKVGEYGVKRLNTY